MAEAARKRESSSDREMPLCKYPRLETPIARRDESSALVTRQRSLGVLERACLRGSGMTENGHKKEISLVLRECRNSEFEAPRAIVSCELSNQTVELVPFLERGDTRVNGLIQLKVVPSRQWEFGHLPTPDLSCGMPYMNHGAEGEESWVPRGVRTIVRVSDYYNVPPMKCKALFANEEVLKTLAYCPGSAWHAEADLQSAMCIPSSDGILEHKNALLEYNKVPSLENLPQAASLFVQVFAMTAERLLPQEDTLLPIDHHLSVLRYLRKQWRRLDQNDRRCYAEAAQELKKYLFESSQDKIDDSDTLSLFVKCLFATDEDARLHMNADLSLKDYLEYSAESIDDDQSTWYTESLPTHSQLHVDFQAKLIRGELLNTLSVVPN